MEGRPQAGRAVVMTARLLKPAEANEGGRAGQVLAARDVLSAARCACGECRDLDRTHPSEGFQLRLLSSAQLDGEPGCDPARQFHPDASAVVPAGVSETPRPPKSRSALAASTDRSTPDMTDKTSKEKPHAAKKSAKAAAETPTQGIVPTAIETVRLGDLRRAPENVRHTHADDGIEELADDIAAHGLLQSLIGYRDGKTVQIVGGGRRYQSLRELANRFLITLDFPVPVLIRDREEAVELSLSENLARRDMNPADEFLAFATLMAPGTRSPADLAKRFGFTERYVKQRLKLAGLIPDILDALRAGDMTLEAALAYGRAADQDVQQKVFKAQSKRGYDKHGADRIRYAIDSENKTTDWPLYRFVGAEAYEREGGAYEDAGLFGDTDPDKAAPCRIVDGFKVIDLAHQHVDFQMLRRLEEMAAEIDLDPAQVTGFVKIENLEFGQYYMAYHGIHKQAPDGFAWVGNDYNPDRVERMLKTIRNNRTLVQIPVGIDLKGELVRFSKGFFVPKDQKNAIDPPAAEYQHAPARSDEEIAAERRRDRIEEIAYRRGIGKFAGTPLEGRVYFPSGSRWIDAFVKPRSADQFPEKGQLVAVQIWVTEVQATAELDAAEQDYEDQLREEAEAAARRERERAEEAAAREKREAEFGAMDPPAVVVIDGEAWARIDGGDEDGAYATIDEVEDGYICSWPDLLDSFDVDNIGDTFATREAFDAAIAGAAEDGGTPAADDGDADAEAPVEELVA